jgi:hypothetical protein
VSAYLSIVAIYRDEAVYLPEWIEFHRLVGVDRFFLYNNFSVDDHREVLAPYVEEGVVTIRDWPVFPGQLPAYNDAIRRYRGESRWLAFIDVDEFLFSPAGVPVAELLHGYEEAPGVVVHRAEFGTSGHRTRPPGLVTESYLHRSPHRPDSRAYYKSIVDPSRVVRCVSVHHFDYRAGALAVDENNLPMKTGIRAEKTFVSFSKLRINHYRTKSEEELHRKWAMWADTGKMQADEPPESRLEMSRTLVEDEAIATYVPALREALRGQA